MRNAPPDYHVRETLLSQKPREWSLEITALFLSIIMGTSLLSWRNGEALLPTLAATPEGVFGKHEYWRLFTAVAVHANVPHVFSNAILLVFFTYLLFGYFGFWVFPVSSLVMAALTNYISLLTYPTGVSLIGASGLVYWMAGFWFSMYLLVERSLSPAKRGLRVVCLSLLVLLPSTIQANISYRTHAIGLALGVISAIVYFRRNREVIREAELLEWDGPPDESEQVLPS